MTTDELWQPFYFHLQVKRRSKTTLRYYLCTQQSFNTYLETHGPSKHVGGLRVSHLLTYREELTEKNLVKR